MPISFSNAMSLIVVLLIGWSLYRAHKDTNGLSHFSLFDLLMENGRVSRIASVFMGGFFVVSWIMIQLQISGKMTEGYMGLYFAGIISPLISKLFSPPAPPVTITESSSSTKTTERT